jgi:hypothetical protein
LDITTFEYIGIFEAQTNGNGPGILIRKTAYFSQYKGVLPSHPDLGDIVWLTFLDRENVSDVDKLIFDFLKDSGQLV